MIYQVNKDINILDQIITKDSIINFGDSDIFEYKHSDGTISTIRKSYVESNNNLFSKLESKTEELSNSDEIKRYRIQLDINCKYSDLNKFKTLIESTIESVINSAK